jgi:hypothetical protein
MRKLSDTFMENLQQGFLVGLLKAVREDQDLDLQIRNNYLNIYFKGNSLLKLTEMGADRYQAYIHPKFLEGITVSDITDGQTTTAFLNTIPWLKENIIKYGKASLEVEYEQLIIRANNTEFKNTTEYFIVDRQYTIDQYRFDLIGFYWDRRRRRKGQTVIPVLMEVKFALNADISDVHQQIGHYFELVQANTDEVVTDLENMFRQSLELGLYDQPAGRLEAMKTLVFSRNIEQFRFILILVDYNPHSSKFDMAKLKELPFADQIRVFQTGFAMWDDKFEI